MTAPELLDPTVIVIGSFAGLRGNNNDATTTTNNSNNTCCYCCSYSYCCCCYYCYVLLLLLQLLLQQQQQRRQRPTTTTTITRTITRTTTTTSSITVETCAGACDVNLCRRGLRVTNGTSVLGNMRFDSFYRGFRHVEFRTIDGNFTMHVYAACVRKTDFSYLDCPNFVSVALALVLLGNPFCKTKFAVSCRKKPDAILEKHTFLASVLSFCCAAWDSMHFLQEKHEQEDDGHGRMRHRSSGHRSSASCCLLRTD